MTDFIIFVVIRGLDLVKKIVISALSVVKFHVFRIVVKVEFVLIVSIEIEGFSGVVTLSLEFSLVVDGIFGVSHFFWVLFNIWFFSLFGIFNFTGFLVDGNEIEVHWLKESTGVDQFGERAISHSDVGFGKVLIGETGHEVHVTSHEVIFHVKSILNKGCLLSRDFVLEFLEIGSIEDALSSGFLEESPCEGDKEEEVESNEDPDNQTSQVLLDDHENETSTNGGEGHPQDDFLGIDNISKILLDTGGGEGGVDGFDQSVLSWDTDSTVEAFGSVDEEWWGVGSDD